MAKIDPKSHDYSMKEFDMGVVADNFAGVDEKKAQAARNFEMFWNEQAQMAKAKKQLPMAPKITPSKPVRGPMGNVYGTPAQKFFKKFFS